MTVREIYDYLNSLYPVSTACDFDNAGLLVGNPDTEVKKALISLDCTLNTVKKAEESDCQLIVTHHPVIFEPLKNVLKGSVVYELVNNGISVISMHTNLDIAYSGVSDSLCKAIGLTEIKSYTACDGFLLRCGVVPSVSAESFAERLKNTLNGSIRYVDGGKPIEKVLVCSGSGGEFIEDAINGGFDALVTSEIKHHQFLMADDNGISLFDGGHFNTEDIVIEPLKSLLSEKFDTVEFITDHTSKIQYK